MSRHRRSPVRRRPAAATLLAAALLAAALAPPAGAWFTVGHAKVTRSAVAALPASMPAFFRAGGRTIGEASVDPDLYKLRAAPMLRSCEEPHHFLDWEMIDRADLPADRWQFVAMAQRLKIAPEAVGLLPYAVVESFDRLSITFAEHRRWPHDPAIQQKALVYAGILAHYAGDLEQPLHTSLHHDGRALPDGSSPHTGIHQLVDGLLEQAPFDLAAVMRDLPIRELPDPWAAVRAEIAASHALVDRCYALEPQLRQANEAAVAAGRATPPPRRSGESAGPAVPSDKAAVTASPEYPPVVTAFAGERYRATASFLASLFHAAWQRSATLELPGWLARPPAEGVEIILGTPAQP